MSVYKKLFLGAIVCIAFSGAGCTQMNLKKPLPPNTPSTVSSTKKYVAQGKEQCERLRFQCEVGKRAFFDDIGCGCEDDNDSKLPEVCTMEYKPVCGELEVNCIKAPCLPIQKTYSNRCLAEKENALNIKEGECKTEKACTMEYKPVCGQMQPRCLVEPCLPIQQTYSNRCMAEKAGVEKIIEGECKKNPQEYIKVPAIKAGDVIASPLVIKAEAVGTWFFEGSFPITVTDNKGVNLGTGLAKAESDWMVEKFVPFTAKITFKKTTAVEGFVVFKNDNPSGDPKMSMELKIPVRFTPAESTGICPALYKPVCGEKKEDGGPFPTSKTYSNRCVAEKEGATNITDGVCEKPKEITCKISGCNRELCSESMLTSICIAKPEFECYKTAACEVQKNGACAWTQTATLQKCLDNARKTGKVM